MRHWLLLLIMVALAHAQFYSPPISQVMQNNEHLGPGLENHYDASNALSFSIPGGYVSGSTDIAGMSLLLDNATYPEDGLAVLLARGIREPESGYSICNYSYEGVVTFHFKGSSFPSEFFTTSPMPTIVQVPPEVLEAMKDSSGADQLDVGVLSTMWFVPYNNGMAGCNYSDVYSSNPFRFTAHRSFTVYGTNKLYFLRAPLLREQWFRDNQFDTVILSQSPLYQASIMLNGNTTRNLTLRTFEVVNDAYGIEKIVSNLSNPDGWSENVNLTTPTLLEVYPDSFAYAYEFNYSYQGLGQNNLSLVINDSFMGSARYDESLLSRMLSYNGTSSEGGSPASSVPSRPSATFTTDHMSSFALALGLLALLFILSFVDVWLLK